MPKQHAFPGLRDAMKKKVTRREQFLAEMVGAVASGQSRLAQLFGDHVPERGA